MRSVLSAILIHSVSDGESQYNFRFFHLTWLGGLAIGRRTCDQQVVESCDFSSRNKFYAKRGSESHHIAFMFTKAYSRSTDIFFKQLRVQLYVNVYFVLNLHWK